METGCARRTEADEEMLLASRSAEWHDGRQGHKEATLELPHTGVWEGTLKLEGEEDGCSFALELEQPDRYRSSYYMALCKSGTDLRSQIQPPILSVEIARVGLRVGSGGPSSAQLLCPEVICCSAWGRRGSRYKSLGVAL